MDVPRPASELIAHLDAMLGVPTLIQLPDGDTPVNIVVIVKSVAPDGDVNFRFGQSANTTWLDLSAILREGPRQYDLNVMAALLRSMLRGPGGDVDGFLRGLGLQP